VPVLRNVENMNYAEIEKSLNDLGEKVCVIVHIDSDISVNIATYETLKHYVHTLHTFVTCIVNYSSNQEALV